MITEILRKYGAGEITAEEANEALRAENAGFSVDPVKAGKGEWTEQEMKEGFFDAERKYPVYPDETDKQRRTDLAGLTVIQKTKKGTFAVSYDEEGYHIVSKRVEF